MNPPTLVLVTYIYIYIYIYIERERERERERGRERREREGERERERGRESTLIMCENYHCFVRCFNRRVIMDGFQLVTFHVTMLFLYFF